MTGWRYVNVKRTGDSMCHVTVTNAPETSTGEHKIKISSFMISARGEVVDGHETTMLTQAMTNLGSSSHMPTGRRPNRFAPLAATFCPLSSYMKRKSVDFC